jgi:uncharacterized membrane protein (UPF0182 family)
LRTIIDPAAPLEWKSRRRKLILLVALLFAIFLLGRIALSNWVDLLWFRSLGYGSVFWTTIWLQVILFAGAALVTFVVLYPAFWGIRRSHQGNLPTAHAITIGGQPVRFSVQPALRFISLAVSIVFALIAGFTMVAEWPVMGLFWYAPHATGSAADSIFGKPLNFFLFTLPAWQLINNWLLTLAIATCAVAVLFLFITSGSRTLENRKLSYGPSPWRGLSLTVAFLLFVLAMTTYVSRFETLLEHHTIFDGVNYTDAHVSIPGALILCAALLLGAVIAAVNALRESRGRRILIAIAPAIVCYVAIGVIGWYVGNFIVNPNQLDREEPYIAHNIEATRRAYGLDRFSQSEFPAETTPDAVDAANNQATLQNVRLWDWHALQDTLRQIQEIRTYYDFPDIDIDRYDLNGTTREVMLAARELD